ncbi:PorV/PorQ family protein [Candidatus Poribacteria bacterium]|nr:PorV/PorQ family protein [Candidatus Poribacteria bacterium]
MRKRLVRSLFYVKDIFYQIIGVINMPDFKKLSTTIYLAILLFLIPSILYAVGGKGGYAGTYLRIGVGARPLGMGGAFTALSDDATASYWNAAGLEQIKRPQFSCMYSLMSMDRTLNIATYAQPIGEIGTLGFGWLNYGVRDIDGRDISGNPTGSFSDSENAFTISLGKDLSSILLVGGSFKFLYHKLASQQATGYGFDVGVILKLGESIKIGGKIQDINSKIQWDTESKLEEEFPITTRFGISILPKEIPFIFSADVEKNSKQNNKYHVGAEYWFISSLAVRFGYNKRNFTAGVTVVIPITSVDLQLDYALAPDELNQWPVNRVSITAKF